MALANEQSFESFLTKNIHFLFLFSHIFPHTFPHSPSQTVMVVGAGRGPLVHAALNASRETGVPVRVFAVEKNPGCVLRLVHIGDFDSQWRKTVVVVGQDMRGWNAPVKADILVSELLGSFG